MATRGSVALESKLSPEAAEFVPQGNCAVSNLENAVSGDNCDAVSVTNTAMLKLLSNPEAFFEVVNPLVDDLSVLITDPSSLDAVIEHIFQQSIFQPNYQYTGARLCTVLSEKLSVTFENGTFRDILLRRCKTEYEKCDELKNTADGLEELAGFTLFFAEFVPNIPIENPLNVFGPKIFDLLLLLLSASTADCVQCVKKVLKLTGSALESIDLERMNEIFVKVKDVIIRSDTPKEVRGMLLSLVALRAQKWGVESEATSANTQNGNCEALPDPEFRDENGDLVYEDYAGETEGYDYGMYAGYVANGYVAEGFDAGEITEENYEVWVPEEEDNCEFEGIPCVIGNDEMDPEMDEAYEQFLAQLNPSSSEMPQK